MYKRLFVLLWKTDNKKGPLVGRPLSTIVCYALFLSGFRTLDAVFLATFCHAFDTLLGLGM